MNKIQTRPNLESRVNHQLSCLFLLISFHENVSIKTHLFASKLPQKDLFQFHRTFIVVFNDLKLHLLLPYIILMCEMRDIFIYPWWNTVM